MDAAKNLQNYYHKAQHENCIWYLTAQSQVW